MEIAEQFWNGEVERFTQELDDVEALSKKSGEFQPDLLNRLLNAEKEMAAALKDIEHRLGHDPKLIEKAMQQFRHIIQPWYGQSFLMKRATEKPMGYPGDFLLLECIYDQTTTSEGFGSYLDRVFLSDQLAVAVRNRKDKIKEWLTSELHRIGSRGSEIQILNIASGSCREWHELLFDTNDIPFHLTCVDFDQQALDFAQQRLQGRNSQAHFNFCRDNAIRLAVRKNNQELFGPQDIIYSFGLYDYLSDKVLKRLLKSQFELLKPGGRMALTFKDKYKYEGIKHAWFCDWHFEQRGTEDVYHLLDDIGIDQRCVSTTWEKSDTIVFFQITKAG